jgi:inosose dehydratase
MTAIRIANAPCSWGSLEFEGFTGEVIPYGRMLDELRDTGYKGTELGDWGYMPTTPDLLDQEMAQRHLNMVGAFVPVKLKDASAHDQGKMEALRIARLLAGLETAIAPFIILADENGTDLTRTKFAGHISPEMGLSDAEWETFVRGAESIARLVLEMTGLRTAFHPHCAGYVETPEEIAHLLELTDPRLLGLVFDTGHYLYGTGQNDGTLIKEGLDRFADRIWHVHFKDCQPRVASKARLAGWDYFSAVQHGVFCELGDGAVPFATVADWLRERAYQGWIVVEQDVLPGMGTPKASAQRNRDYLRTIGL